jgi:hypothetical protein
MDPNIGRLGMFDHVAIGQDEELPLEFNNHP